MRSTVAFLPMPRAFNLKFRGGGNMEGVTGVLLCVEYVDSVCMPFFFQNGMGGGWAEMREEKEDRGI